MSRVDNSLQQHDGRDGRAREVKGNETMSETNNTTVAALERAAVTVLDKVPAGEVAEALKFLHEYLYHSGAKRLLLSNDARMEVLVECDGFGRLSAADLYRLELTWDWSHVRDSSDFATLRAAATLKRLLADKSSWSKSW